MLVGDCNFLSSTQPLGHKRIEGMDNGYMIREKNHQTSKVCAFWACQSAAQTKSIYVEKNVATVLLL